MMLNLWRLSSLSVIIITGPYPFSFASHGNIQDVSFYELFGSCVFLSSGKACEGSISEVGGRVRS